MPGHPSVFRDSLIMVTAAVALAAGLSPWLGSAPQVAAGSSLAATAIAGGVLALHTAHGGDFGLGWADRITLARLAIAAVLAGQLAGQPSPPATGLILAALALGGLALDGLDGWLARHRGEATAFGARLDMEADAILILVLSGLIWRRGGAGAWVLGIGALRYAFLLARTVWPRLNAALPPSQRRRVVCAIQVAVLPVCLLPAMPATASSLLAATALALLCYSFTVDTHWLVRHGEPPSTTE